MKIVFLFLLLLGTCSLNGQADKTRYSLQYAVHFSDAAGAGPGSYYDPGLGQNAVFTTELASKRSARFTIGAGYLQSKLISSDWLGVNHDFVEQHHSLHFLVVPAGVKISFGSFYFHPEVAATYYFKYVRNSYVLDSNMNIPDEPYDHDVSNKPFGVQFANFMTIGYEIKVNSTAILTGLKGYFAFNNNYVNTFGIGLTVGVKI